MDFKCIFVVDMNKGFCEEGNLADPTIKHIVPNIKELLGKFNMNDIYFVNDWHTKKDIELKRYPEHCLLGPETEVINEFGEYKKHCLHVFKNTTCALFEKEIKKIIKDKAYDNIYIVGCCTDICIMNFAVALRAWLDHKDLEKHIIVPKNCVETFNSDKHNRDEWNNIAFKVMEANGIVLI